jgi:hypothetical protein
VPGSGAQPRIRKLTDEIIIRLFDDATNHGHLACLASVTSGMPCLVREAHAINDAIGKIHIAVASSDTWRTNTSTHWLVTPVFNAKHVAVLGQ